MSGESRAGAGDEEVRYRAMEALDPAEPGGRALLLEGLADPSWRVRAAVVERLGGAADPGPLLGPLAAALVSEKGIGARDAAAAALARVGAPAVPVLVARLQDGSAELRQAATTVLGQIGDHRAAGPLAGRLLDPDVNVRIAAVEAIARAGGPGAGAALRRVLEGGEPALRLPAVEGLAALRTWPAGLAIDALLADPVLRRPAYRLLGACDEPAVSAPLAAGLAERARTAREAALAAVGQQRARRTVEALAPLAAAVRAEAAANPGLADACADALASDEPYVALGALAVLGWAGSARHARAVLRLAADARHRTVVEEVLEALPQDAELRAALADAMPELGAVARLTALSALARLGSPAALESLVREASDPDAYVQAEAMAALGRLSDARVVAPLAGLLGDEDPAAAGVAADTLVRIARADAETRAAVLAALRGRAGVRPSAALYRALGALGDAGDLAILRAGVANGSPAQRAAIAAAVAALDQHHRSARPAVAAPAPVLREEAFRLLRELVHAYSGLWFRDDTMYLVERRLGARVQALGLPGFEAYHRYLLHDPRRAEELDDAVELLTTNETYLFREPLQLAAFAGEILPRLAKELAARRKLRVLSAGCSTGEEAYTAAVLVRESGLFDGWDVEVVGSDLSRRCIAQARVGAYAESAFRSPEAERVRRWFQLRGGKWVVDDEIRRSVRFVRDNLLAPRALATLPRVDVVFCRNVMIYFDLEARRKVLRRLHERMRPGAWLLLGHSESLLGVTADFELVHLREDLVYRRPPGLAGAAPEVA